MLYHLFQYLDRSYDLPGAGMFQYISFRSALAVILALLITITFGQGIIRFMQRRQARRSATSASKASSRNGARPRWAA